MAKKTPVAYRWCIEGVWYHEATKPTKEWFVELFDIAWSVYLRSTEILPLYDE